MWRMFLAALLQLVVGVALLPGAVWGVFALSSLMTSFLAMGFRPLLLASTWTEGWSAIAVLTSTGLCWFAGVNLACKKDSKIIRICSVLSVIFYWAFLVGMVLTFYTTETSGTAGFYIRSLLTALTSTVVAVFVFSRSNAAI